MDIISIIATAIITCLTYELVHGIVNKFKGQEKKNVEKKRR